MERQRLSNKQADEIWAGYKEKEIIQWYRKWRDDPWGYALITGSKKLLFVFILWVLISWDMAKQLLAHPAAFIQDHWEKILLAIVAMIFFTSLEWRRKAIQFYLLSGKNPGMPTPDGDHRIIQLGKKSEKRIPVKWKKWGDQKLTLALLFSVGITVLFFASLYLLHGFTENKWTWASFMGIFEEGVFYMVLVTFLVLGFMVGYSIWKEIRDNYQLLTQKDSSHG